MVSRAAAGGTIVLERTSTPATARAAVLSFLCLKLANLPSLLSDVVRLYLVRIQAVMLDANHE